MKPKSAILLLCLVSVSALAENEGIHVYGPVPGLAPSEFYSFRVRTVGSTQWLDPFALITRCREGGSTNRYYEHLEDWSNSYINFEMSNNVPVEIEISRVGGEPIQTAVPHPHHRVSSCEVVDGNAYVVIDDPALFTVDIDGQMDDQDTARIHPTGWADDDFYTGPPIHTVTVFANPFLQHKPVTDDPNVLLVHPGTVPPDTGSWDTLYFLPGIHDIGRHFNVHADKRYYIPGDAVVHGTMNNRKDWNDGHDIRIFGHGTLSGERYPHPDDDTPPAPDTDDWKYKPIDIVGAWNTTVEGITIADSPMHSLMLISGYRPETPTDIRWVKIFTWRGNGDGINPFGNGLVEDCFIRTADDCTYVNGRGIRRVVYWTDVNGSAFVLSPIGNMHTNQIVVEDCDILYNRSIFSQNLGGRVFNLRGAGSGAGGSNVVFRNIRVHDPRPTLSVFGIQAAAPWQVSPDYDATRGDGDISGIGFENIDIAAHSIIGDPETLWGNTNVWLREFVFDTVTIAGELIDELGDFNHNAYVTNMVFLGPPSLNYAPTVLRESTADDGRIAGSIYIDLNNDAFSADVANGGHVAAGNVPAGLTPVFTRTSDTQVTLSLTGGAWNHAADDSINDLTVAFADSAFVASTASEVIGATNGGLEIVFSNPVLFRDSFEDGDLATATAITDVAGGFDTAVSHPADLYLEVYESSGNGVLDLVNATNDFPYVAMVSKHAFDGAAQDSLQLSFDVAGLAEAWWFLRPFTVNLRPNAVVNPQVYHRGLVAPPLGLSLMVGNQDSADCRVALVAYDGTEENWLWEDLDVTHAELADGFSVTITVDRNGWDVAFTGAASLPAAVSGTWDTLGWNDIFNDTTHVQCYLREDSLTGKSRSGRARADIASIEVTSGRPGLDYSTWAARWAGVDLGDPSADHDGDGRSNFMEYALDGDPTHPADRGRLDVRADASWFTVVHAVNIVDGRLLYRLLDMTNLTGGAVQTNGWDSQSLGPILGEYRTVTNRYEVIGKPRQFIGLDVEQQ